jgi:hypothetical protein
MKHQPLFAIPLELAEPIPDLWSLDPIASIKPPEFAKFDQLPISYVSFYVSLSNCSDCLLIDGTGRYHLVSVINQPSLKVSRLQSETTVVLDEHTSADEAVDQFSNRRLVFQDICSVQLLTGDYVARTASSVCKPEKEFPALRFDLIPTRRVVDSDPILPEVVYVVRLQGIQRFDGCAFDLVLRDIRVPILTGQTCPLKLAPSIIAGLPP